MTIYLDVSVHLLVGMKHKVSEFMGSGETRHWWLEAVQDAYLVARPVQCASNHETISLHAKLSEVRFLSILQAQDLRNDKGVEQIDRIERRTSGYQRTLPVACLDLAKHVLSPTFDPTFCGLIEHGAQHTRINWEFQAPDQRPFRPHGMTSCRFGGWSGRSAHQGTGLGR